MKKNDNSSQIVWRKLIFAYYYTHSTLVSPTVQELLSSPQSDTFKPSTQFVFSEPDSTLSCDDWTVDDDDVDADAWGDNNDNDIKRELEITPPTQKDEVLTMDPPTAAPTIPLTKVILVENFRIYYQRTNERATSVMANTVMQALRMGHVLDIDKQQIVDLLMYIANKNQWDAIMDVTREVFF